MGEPADARGDIYSLGVTLFELFTSVRPFEGRSSGDLTAAILSDPTPHARDRNPAVPEALDAIVYRAMARVPDQRFHSARDLADELKRAATRLYEAPTRSGVAAVSVPIAVAPARGALRAMRTATGRRPLLSAAAAIAVAAALYAALASPRSRSFEVSAAPPESPVVAVLPLANTTGHAEDEALATGIADTLVSTLSQVPGVTVVARSATLPYRDRKKSTDDIARALGATLLVDGALQRSGDRVRVNLSLLRPRSNVLSWARSYDGSFSNVFALQHEVATAVANTLRLAIPSDARRRVDRPSTDSVQAFAEYSQARAFLDRPDVKGNLDRAMGLFKSAIAKDPHFARAHAGLGQAYWRRYTESRELDWAMQARDETSEALRLDPADGRVRYTLALIDYSKGRLAEAEEELRRAAESNPTLDDAHNLLGRILNETGRPEEAAAELKLAIELRPAFWGHYQTLGIAYFRRGLWKEASAAFKRVTELQPDSAWGFQMLGTTFQAMGDNAEAVTHYQHAIEIAPDAMAYANLGTIYYSDGRLTEAAHAFEKAMELEPKNAANHRNLGDLYRRVGESTKARAAYGHAIELSMDRLKTNPRDARAMAALAVYEAKIGDNRDSQSHAASALALTRTDPDVLYANAVVYALTGNAAQSMQMLREAIALGYSVAFARTDEDLAVLHGRPEFSPLVEGDGRRQKGG
jgi:tetratricopeptide (TPR) repeat protein